MGMINTGTDGMRAFCFALVSAGALALGACAGPDRAPSMVERETAAAPAVRFAVFNVYLNRPEAGALLAEMRAGDSPQARKVAEIIQRTAPDVLLLNEFDYEPSGEALRLFQENYLEKSWNGAPPAVYPYVFLAPSNTGVHSGVDLNRDGAVAAAPGSRDYGGDAFGYGEFPGKFAMAFLSKYPIAEDDVRTFRNFLWKDMPGARLPDDPDTPEPADWYAGPALDRFRLSSKSHWDIPVLIGGRAVHVLASHPTPPGFDGEEDRNGRRNFDENRFWADYVTPGRGSYINDDAGGEGGLEPGARFVIMGDLNADPTDGAAPGSIRQLLNAPAAAPARAPRSRGGAAQAELQGGANARHRGDPAEDTSDFNDDPETGAGNLRLDYVIASRSGLVETGSGVFWPAPGDPHYGLVGPGFPVESSDHRLVWRDLVVTERRAGQ